MRVSVWENFRIYGGSVSVFARIKKFSVGEDSATGHCEVCFQQTRDLRNRPPPRSTTRRTNLRKLPARSPDCWRRRLADLPSNAASTCANRIAGSRAMKRHATDRA